MATPQYTGFQIPGVNCRLCCTYLVKKREKKKKNHLCSSNPCCSRVQCTMLPMLQLVNMKP